MVKLIVSAINNPKSDGWRTRAASYFIDHGSHFPYILYGDRERADPQKGVAIITWCYHASRPFQPRSQSFTATHQFHVVVNWTELWWPEIENHVTVLVALNVAEAATRHCTKSSVEALFNCHSVWVLRWYWIWLYTCPSPLLPLHLPLTPNSLTGTLPQGPR